MMIIIDFTQVGKNKKIKIKTKGGTRAVEEEEVEEEDAGQTGAYLEEVCDKAVSA